MFSAYFPIQHSESKTNVRGRTHPLCKIQEMSKQKARNTGFLLVPGIKKNMPSSCTKLSQRALSTSSVLFSVSGERTTKITEFRDKAKIPADSES